MKINVLNFYSLCINHMSSLFTRRLKDFSEWGQCQVLDLLRRYQPVSEDDLFDVLVSHTPLGAVIVDIWCCNIAPIYKYMYYSLVVLKSILQSL